MTRNFLVSVAGGFVGVILALLLLSFTNSASALSLNRSAVSPAPASIVSAPSATPISSTFTYQGQLKNGGSPVNGACNMAFRLYDDPSTGNLIGSPITLTTVSIVNGYFTAGLNFGNSTFTGGARWLDIRVRCPAGSGSYTTLTPRQPITAAPYALAFGAPGGMYGYLYDAASPGPYPTLGFNTYDNSYLAGVSGYGGIFQFQDGDGSLVYYTGSNVPAGAPHVNTPRLVIKPDGEVGIGTTSPAAGLAVKGVGLSWVFRAVTSSDQDGLLVYDDGIVKIGKIWTGADASSVHACYNLVLAYSFAACSPAAATYVPMIDRGSGFPETADLVSLFPAEKNPYADERSPFVVGKTTKPCDENLLGFVADPKQGADGEKKNDHYLPLALSGDLPAKVTMENGAIKRGDPLTSSSKPGYAMKATQACKIIGYALEDADHEGTIQVFAHLSENTAPEVASLRAQVQELKAQNAAFEARLTALEKAMQAGGTP